MNDAPPRCTVALLDDDEVDLDRARLRRVVDDACAADGLERVSLHVLFVDDAECTRLHTAHFDDSTPTDVMTFPDGSYDPSTERTHLGDVAVCVDVARREASQRGRSIDDELTLYIAHGLLHILGYDDQTDEDRLEMWQAQRDLLARHGILIEQRPG